MDENEGAGSGVVDAPQVPSGAPVEDGSKPKRGGGKRGRRQPSDLLKALRWAFKTDPEPDEKLTPERRQARELQAKDRVEFLRMLAALEKTHSAGKAKTPPPTSSTSTSGPGSSSGGAAPDPTIDKVLLLIAEVQRRMEPFSAKAVGEKR